MSDTDPGQFDDTQLEEELEYPDWFKISLGDLNDDIAEARAGGKFGIMVYFGQKRCAYCEQFFEVNLGDDSIANYVRRDAGWSNIAARHCDVYHEIVTTPYGKAKYVYFPEPER